VTLKRVVAGAVGAVVLLLGAYAGFLVHRSRHPVSIAPSGPYPVGRAQHEIADRSRTDEFAPIGGNPRVLSVWLWYPAAATGKTPSAYAPGPWSDLHKFGVAQTRFDRVRTGTYDDVPVADGQFPLVVLLPGLGFAAPQYAAIASRIAAQGYIVAGVTPTYSAGVTVLGGRAVTATKAGDPSELDGPQGDRLATVWAADARYTARMVGVMLGVSADRGKVAYVGHSFGGAAALEACRGDQACVGAADLDGTPYGMVATTGLRRPLLMLSSASGGAVEDPSARSLFAASGSTAWAYTIAGAQHFDFTDYAAYWLAAPVRAALPLGSSRTLATTGKYLTAFLDSAVHGTAWRAPPITGVRAADMLSR
jgi:dienelactone hydrolase